MTATTEPASARVYQLPLFFSLTLELQQGSVRRVAVRDNHRLILEAVVEYIKHVEFHCTLLLEFLIVSVTTSRNRVLNKVIYYFY